MAQTPYSDQPARAFWSRAMARTAPEEVDPVTEVPFTIGPDDRIVTAGSCFAEHIARHLRGAGFNALVTEPAHPMVGDATARQFNYGIFTARYGNIYVARQLLQLLRRAYGRFQPAEDCWPGEGAALIDPYRPRIQPGGFACGAEFEAERAKHFAAVRAAFETLDVFVFTLGLTEAWVSRADGAVFPLCPGVAGGSFDPERHEFHNFTVDEIVADLSDFIAELRAVNPGARVLFTVSPVPLAATATKAHVLSATTLSKSILRVACHQLAASHENVAYFPSYEVIVGPHHRGRYMADDLRSVTEEGVAHAMRLFFRHFAGIEQPAPQAAAPGRPRDAHLDAMQEVVEVNCDEAELDDAAPRPDAPRGRGILDRLRRRL
ncbi:hypothetical protein Ga0609869_000520 [Rhodovulum iodosum]|uniref:GSCFA domain-containing protein n=1 Tax=Rhodovulum iodosum TaxID=68291 RepID=A0ABV3XRU3_9RHOB|nr:GSCFA domain-containing protein [Rhodovulum robiginosum]RSK31533.1 GSCFA domain-containing protein [Rhodovulum robiginosum]